MNAIGWMTLAVCAASTACVRSANAAADGYDITRLEPTGLPYHDTAGHSGPYVYVAALRNGVALSIVTRFDGDTPAGSDVLYHGAAGDVVINPLDAEHVGPNGTSGYTDLLNGVGSVVGGSDRYSTAVLYDHDAWYYSPSTGAVLIGPRDGQHADVGATALRDNNVVLGTAHRFLNGGFRGDDAWVYSPATGTHLIGLRDAAHTQGDGSAEHYATLDASGTHVIGTSTHYNSSRSLGEDAWIATVDGTTQQIGLPVVDQPPFGTVDNDAVGSNAAGRVIGNYDYRTLATGGTQVDYDDAWLYVPGVGTQPIGLHDAAHVTPDGRMSHRAIDINDAGVVIGQSVTRASLEAPAYPFHTARNDAWYYSPQSGIRTITMTDAVHTLDDGTHNSNVIKVNASGNVIGSSDRTLGGADAWFYTAAGDRQIIGLTDAEHRQADGEVQNEARLLTDADQVVGRSLRSDGKYDLFYFTPARGSRPIGLVDTDHPAQDDPGYSVNAIGMVLGSAQRTVATPYGTEIFADPWVFDPVTDKTYSLVAPGWAGSGVFQLSDSGVAVGSYTLDDEHNFAFSWTVAGGFRTLGELVVPDLATRGWAALRQATFVDALGNIAGSGARIGDGPDDAHAFLLTPAVPEPAAIASLSALAAAFAMRRRRERR